MTSTFAFGKIILLGEHAVVYGHTAIAGAIDLGIQCAFDEYLTPGTLEVSAWNLSVQANQDHPVAHALKAIRTHCPSFNSGISGTANLPVAAGLGSSAALCVSLAKLLAPKESSTRWEEIANLGEIAFHQKPSGIDVAVSVRGGMGHFDKKRGFTPLPYQPLPLVIGLSGLPRNTRNMVHLVAKRIEKDAQASRDIEAIAQIAQEGIGVLEQKDWKKTGQLMNQNHQALRSLGVSVPALDAMVQGALDAGALGAKLTGAGGGGAIIALAPGKQKEVCLRLESLGYTAFATTWGATQT